MLNRTPTFIVGLALAVASVLTVVQCGGNKAVTPSITVSSVTISPASIAAGATAQGTVTLSGTGGSAVTLTSGNAAVATVPGSVNVPAGAASALFTVTGVAAGTAVITASANGGQGTANITVTGTTPPPPPPPTILSLSLSATSVIGGNPVTGTIVLGSAAPAGGAAVTLSAADPVTVPGTVIIPAGQTSATFTINTRAVGGAFTTPIMASFNGATSTATLIINPVAPVPAVARFTVSGASGTDACKLINSGNSFDCTFDGSASTAPATINLFTWTYTIAGTNTETSPTSIFNPKPNCGLLPSPLPSPKPASLQMIVTLKISDTQGNTASATNNNVRILPSGQACGF